MKFGDGYRVQRRSARFEHAEQQMCFTGREYAAEPQIAQSRIIEAYGQVGVAADFLHHFMERRVGKLEQPALPGKTSLHFSIGYLGNRLRASLCFIGLSGLQQDRRGQHRRAGQCTTLRAAQLVRCIDLLFDGHTPLGHHHPDVLTLQVDHERGTYSVHLSRVRSHYKRPISLVHYLKVDLALMQVNNSAPAIVGHRDSGIGIEPEEATVTQFLFEITADRCR